MLVRQIRVRVSQTVSINTFGRGTVRSSLVCSYYCCCCLLLIVVVIKPFGNCRYAVVGISRPRSDLSDYRSHSQVWLPSPRERSSAYKRRRGFQYNADWSVQCHHAVYYTGGDALHQCQQWHCCQQLIIIVPRLDVWADVDVYFNSYRIYVLRNRRGIYCEADSWLTVWWLWECWCLVTDGPHVHICGPRHFDRCCYCWWLGCYNILTYSCVSSKASWTTRVLFAALWWSSSASVGVVFSSRVFL